MSGPSLDHLGHWIDARLKKPTPRRVGQLLGQSAKSWYVYALHTPVLPELAWRGPLGKRWPRILERFEKVTGGDYAWTYRTVCGEHWLDSSKNNDGQGGQAGNITGKVCRHRHHPRPSQTPTGPATHSPSATPTPSESTPPGEAPVPTPVNSSLPVTG
jgi:hypothetical protein